VDVISVRWGAAARRARGEEGQSLVEFALLAPVLFAVLIGIFKCAVAFNNYIVLTDAVRAGARQLAISRGVSGACTSAVTRVQTSATDLSPSGLVVDPPLVNGSNANCTDLGSGNQQGNDAQISASYPCDLVIMGFDFAPGCRLKSTMTERIE
jgi:Flp pilus assembly protein TadG